MNINKDYLQFERLANIINLLLKDKDISLSFLGYKDFMSEYVLMIQVDIHTMLEINKQALMWSNYISEIRSIINLHLRSLELDKNILLIDRYKNKKRVKDLDEKIVLLKLFLRHLNIQHNICVSIFFKTVKSYRDNYNNLNFTV